MIGDDSFGSAIDFEGGDQTRGSPLVNAQLRQIQKETEGFGKRKIVGENKKVHTKTEDIKKERCNKLGKICFLYLLKSMHF